MAAKVVSPLHKVIDSGRWDARRLLGRLIILVHAAFLDVGFVPLPLVPGRKKRGRVPREVGRMASRLSLRYTVPELLHRQDAEAAEVVLRKQVYRGKIVLYVECDGRPVASAREVVHALESEPLLTAGLDATALALRRDARLAALWRRLSDNLCRRALVELCHRNGVVLNPTFMSLPDDVTTAILARLTDGADLARVECTCSAMRSLVAERDLELWKPLYDVATERSSLRFAKAGDSRETTTWKKSYLRARRWWWPILWLPCWDEIEAISIRPWYSTAYLPFYHDNSLIDFPGMFNRDDEPELPEPEDHVTKTRKWAPTARGNRAAAGRGLQGKKWRPGAGAIHAPSSRYRWKHR